MHFSNNDTFKEEGSEVEAAVNYVPQGMIKPYPPTLPSDIRKKKWNKYILIGLTLSSALTIGIALGYKLGVKQLPNEQQQQSQQQQQLKEEVEINSPSSSSSFSENIGTSNKKDVVVGGDSNVNNSNDDDDDDVVFGTKWMSYGDRLILNDTNAFNDASSSEFGGAIDMNGDATVLAVGAYGYNDGTGIVKVMKYIAADDDDISGGGNWIEMGNSINGQFVLERFGASIELSRDGGILVVGSMGSISAVGNIYGRVKAYRYDSYQNSWNQIGQIMEGDYKADRFGISLSMESNGRSFIVGADNNRAGDQNKQRNGYSRVYELSSSEEGKEEWKRKGRVIEGSNGSWTGYAVSMSGDGQTICVGDRTYKAKTNFHPGRVRCFKWWTPEGDWRAMGGNLLGDYHKEQNGYSLSLNEDGTVLAVGAAKYNSGIVRVYSLTNGVWTMRGGRITGENAKDFMGHRVSLNRKGDVLAYTGRGYDGNFDKKDNMGVVRIKRWVDNSWISLGEEILGYQEQDHFGESLAIDDDGTTLVSSANWANGLEYVNAFTLV